MHKNKHAVLRYIAIQMPVNEKKKKKMNVARFFTLQNEAALITHQRLKRQHVSNLFLV